jgi:hypothetical protein
MYQFSAFEHSKQTVHVSRVYFPHVPLLGPGLDMSVEGYSTDLATNAPTIQTVISGCCFSTIFGRLRPKRVYVRPGIFKLGHIFCTVFDTIHRVEMVNITDFRDDVVSYFRHEVADKVVTAYLLVAVLA